METRFNMGQSEPEAYKAMQGLDRYLSTTFLTPGQKELIKIRASQINGCAYCIYKHTKDARKFGETEQRIYLLNAWRETSLYTEEEQAILALTEEVTLIQNQVSDETYKSAARVFTEQQISQIIMAIITINAWNRIGISSGMGVYNS
jgi:AhpD family alkylhydroperoxidase